MVPVQTPTGQTVYAPVPSQYKQNVYEFSSPFGWRESSGRNHNGIDIAMEENTPLVSYTNGTIDYVGEDPGGYGYFVDIKDNQGVIHRFAHLNSITVQEGDTTYPGQQIGLSGNTGLSTGAHLHWEVHVNGNPINPMDWLPANMENRLKQARTGDGTNAVNGAIPIRNGAVVADSAADPSRNVRAASEFSSAAPLTIAYSDAAKTEKTSNYGYRVLAQDRPFREALYSTATRLGIPAQWIADIMARESYPNMRPDAWNGTNIGLIQFGADAATDLGTSIQALAQMDRVQQMEYVYKYLARFKGKLESIGDVAVAIYSPAYLDDWRAGRDFPTKSYIINEYIPALGRDAGRQYRDDNAANVTHTEYVAGCPVCQQSAYGGFLVPHEVPYYG